MNEQWLNELRQKMTDYQWPVPEVSWDEIDQAVAANMARKVRLFWLRRMAAAAVVLLIASVGYWGLLRHEAEPIVEKHWAQEKPFENQSQRDISQGDRNDVTSQTSHAFFDKRSGRAERLSPCEIQESETASSISTVAPDTAKTTAANEKEQPQTVEEKKVKPADKTYPVIYPSDLHQRKCLENRLTAKVYMSSSMTGNQTEFYDISRAHPTSLWVDPTFPNLTVHTEQYVHHRQPVRFGLSLRYRLNDRWSVESGLSYTRLSSDITTVIDDETTVTEQRLNYLGLPINISYELWKSRYFGLYVTGGGMIEKSLDTSPWQISLNGAAGAEYKLTDFFSLYAEPGLGYYFKDGSSTPTIYQDHLLNFNLSFGLRFNLK
jgi:hypothetical protein